MSNGFSTYASYTDLSSINEVEENQVVQNLTVTGKLTLTNPLEVSSGGTKGMTEEGARASLNVYSKDEINDFFTYTLGENPIGTWIDGKTIYRFVWVGEITFSNAQNIVCTLPSNPHTVVNFNCLFQREDGAWVTIPNAYMSNLSYCVNIRTDYVENEDKTNVLVGFGSSYAGAKTVIIKIDYTK